jgi:hypothetical protein
MRYCLFAVATSIIAGCATSVLHDVSHGPPAAVAAFADADTVSWTALDRGVSHITVHDARGPWAIHLVEVDAAACRPVLRAARTPGTVAAAAATSTLGAAALVAINADFFRAPGAIPVNAHVESGVPHIGPTEWPLFAVAADGTWSFGTPLLDGSVRTRADSVRLVQINRSAESFIAYRGTRDGITLFTARADTVKADSSATRLLARLLEGDEGAGRAVIVQRDSPVAQTPVRRGEAVLVAYHGANAWARRRTPGDTVQWSARVVVPARDGRGTIVAGQALGGFPELLRNGQPVLDRQQINAPFGEQRHPRTAIGWTADRARFYMVVVDGRQEPYSDGMSLTEMVWLFQRLGVTDALNLDGGGSTTLVVRGRLVNRPSDDDGERDVANALLLDRCTG